MSIFSTDKNIPLLVGNVLSISTGGAVAIAGSPLKPAKFNFKVMKQKTLVVNDRIRSFIEQDSDESFLKSAANFTYRYAVALVLILVVVWPLPLYFSGYVFSPVMYYVWVAIAVVGHLAQLL